MQKRLISPIIVFTLLAGAVMMVVIPRESSASTVTTLSSTIGKNVVSWRPDNAYAILTYGNSEIYKYDGSSFSMISATLPGSVWDAEWIPSGSSYALLVGVDGTKTTVYKFDGSSCTLAGGYIEYGYTNYGVSWKPDGSYALIVNDWGSLLKYDPGTNSVSKLGEVGWNLRDVEWNPSGAYALLVGDGIYKYDGSTITTVEARGAGYGVYFGVGFKSSGFGAMIVSNSGHFRYFDGSSVSEVGSVGNTLYQVHYGPASDVALATCVNGHLYECDSATINDVPTEAPFLRSIDWRSDGAYAVASGNPYTIKYVPGIALSGQLVYDNWGYSSRQVANITVVALSNGFPVSGVEVSMSAVGGGSFDTSSGTTDSNGVFKTRYTVPIVSSNTTVTVTAVLSKTGYDDGTAQNMTLVGPSLFLEFDVNPITFYLGENATCNGHVSIFGYPEMPVDGAQIQLVGGWGTWSPSITYTDSNGDFSSIYGTHRYIAYDEWHQIIAYKPYYGGDGGGLWLHVLAPPLVSPTLVSPGEGFVTNIFPTMEWDFVWGASLYNVFLGLSPSVSDTEFYARSWGPGGELNQSSWSGFVAPDGKYYWTVMATNSTDYIGPLAAPRYFTLRNGGIPGAPALHLISGPDDDGTYSLEWDSGSDDIYVKEYLVQESQNPSFTSPWEFHINETRLDIRDRPNGIYYYRALTVDSDGQRSLWSQVVSVDVRRVQSESISLSLAPSSITIGAGSIAISGSASPTPSERRDVRISIFDPNGCQSSLLVKTESFNFAAYGYTYYPTTTGTHYVTAQLLSSSGQTTASTQPMPFEAYSGSGLTLFVDKRSLTVDSSIVIWGDLSPSRIGAYIELTLKRPDGVEFTERVGLSTSGFRTCKIFDMVGTWGVSVRWPGDSYLLPCSAGPISIDVTGVPKLAIILSGAEGSNPEDRSWINMTNRAFVALLRHGYAKNEIMYLAYRTDIDCDANGQYDDVDALCTSTNVIDSFLSWAKYRLDESSDLLFYFAGHGCLLNDVSGFTYWDPEQCKPQYVYPSQLRGYLDSVPCRYQVVMLDCCWSGGFIDDLSKPYRLILTSTTESTMSPYITGNFGEGVVWCVTFELFQWLDSGLSYYDSFKACGLHVHTWTNYIVKGSQPMIDDNGDGVPSGVYSGGSDGAVLADMLGLGFVSSQEGQVRNLDAVLSAIDDGELSASGMDVWSVLNVTCLLGENYAASIPIDEERVSHAFLDVIPPWPLADYLVESADGSATEFTVGVHVELNRSEGLNYSAILGPEILNQTGNYYLVVCWEGYDGTTGITGCINLSVEASENSRPSAQIEVTPLIGDITTEFTFDAMASLDLEDAIESLEVRWDFDGDGEWDTDWSTVKIAEHQYSGPGLYTVYLEVRDTGNLTNVTSVQVEVVEAIPEFSAAIVPVVLILLIFPMIARSWFRRRQS